MEVLEDVKQRYLETVLPAEGGEVLVVDGNHAGERGKVRVVTAYLFRTYQ